MKKQDIVGSNNCEILKQVQDDMIGLPRPTGEGWGEGAICKPAFTLAEVIITLGIIGVVAAITLPALITNIQDRVKEKRVQNIQQKFSKATDKMLSVSGLNGYESTLDFVNELKNHLSIAKICENDELRNCWPTEKVIINDDGEEWEISKTKKGKNLKMEDVEGSSKWDDTVGIITGDGTSMILSYNKLCDIDPTKTTNWTSDKSSSTNCIAAVFDWNGSNKPNKFGAGDVKRKADVFALNANGLGQACAIQLGNKCFGAPFNPTPVTKSECEAMISTHGIQSCDPDSDEWAGAVKQCGHVNNLATMEDIGKIVSQFYIENPTLGAKDNNYSLTYKENSATSMGFPPLGSYWIWSNEQGVNSYGYLIVYGRSFYETGTYVSSIYRFSGGGVALCVLN